MNNQELPVKTLNEFLIKIIKPKLQKKPDLKEVIVWVSSWNPATKNLRLGLALGKSTGCSPFCGCAAKQLTKILEKYLIEKFPEIENVYGEAALPSEEFLKEWNKE